MRTRFFLAALPIAVLALSLPLAGRCESPSPLTLTAIPARPFIELRDRQQMVSFDLLLRNAGPDSYRVVALHLSVFDNTGHLVLKRELNQNGHPPALDIVGNRSLAPNSVIDLFQPFTTFSPGTPLTRMHLDVLLMRQDHTAPAVPLTADAVLGVDLALRSTTPAPMCLPLHGLTLVHDGHDLFSHHRRFDLEARFAADPRTAVNPNLYAYDLMSTNAQGDLYKGEASKKENWLSYNAPIYAPAAGVVVESANDIPENSFSGSSVHIPPEAELRDPDGLGNHVLIRHPDGRVSWLLHMRSGSVVVHAGDHVQRGQLIGRIGFSGDSLFPHLHYNVTADDHYPSQGVPSYFHAIDRELGSSHRTFSASQSGQIDTGDLVMSMCLAH